MPYKPSDQIYTWGFLCSCHIYSQLFAEITQILKYTHAFFVDSFVDVLSFIIWQILSYISNNKLLVVVLEIESIYIFYHNIPKFMATLCSSLRYIYASLLLLLRIDLALST